MSIYDNNLHQIITIPNDNSTSFSSFMIQQYNAFDMYNSVHNNICRQHMQNELIIYEDYIDELEKKIHIYEQDNNINKDYEKYVDVATNTNESNYYYLESFREYTRTTSRKNRYNSTKYKREIDTNISNSTTEILTDIACKMIKPCKYTDNCVEYMTCKCDYLHSDDEKASMNIKAYNMDPILFKECSIRARKICL